MKRLTPVLALCCALSYSSKAQEKPLINSGLLIADAIKLHDEGKYKDALQAYKQISRNDTNYVYALYEAALSLHADSQFVEAIRFCEEGLKQRGERHREPDLYTQLAISLDHSGDKARALRIFDSAQKKYPDFVPLYFNQAVTHIRADDYDKAIPLLQKALLINPYHASSHFRLAQMALIKGRPVDGFLGFATYLMIEPTGGNQAQAIKLMNAIAGGDEDILKYMRDRTAAPPDNIAEVETIVTSKIALNKNYKPILKLDDAISRQLQVICEKLVYDKDEKDFVMQYYVPLYISLLQEKRFEPFVNLIFSGVNIDPIQKYVKSHKKEIEKMVIDVVAYTNEIKATRELNYSRRKAAAFRYLPDGSLIGQGTVKDKTETGQWKYTFSSGNITAKGEFNAQGKKTGVWSYYYFDGTLKGTETLKDGVLEGTSIDYHPNGNMSETVVFKNDKREGESKTWYYSGALSKIRQFKDNKLHGEVISYYSSGELKQKAQYADDLMHGKFISFYRNGKTETEAVYVNDKLEGPCVGYHENGKKSFEGNYKADQLDGYWKRYHENGQLSSTETYVGGVNDGEYIAYHNNGKVRFKTVYKKGAASGEVVYFEKDGKPWAVYVFDKNDIKSARFLDANGKEIGSSVAKNNKLQLTVYNQNGTKASEKFYNEKGYQTDTETVYYPNGSVRTVINYKDGELHGKYTGYFLNGKKDYEYSYAAGVKDGYYYGYHLNGKVASEGWYKDGIMTGDWYYYDNHGKLKTKAYYLNGELEGYKEDYYPTGHKRVEQYHHLGWFIDNTLYDTLGRYLNHIDLPKLSGPFVITHLNGKKFIDGKVENGNFVGPKLYYYPNGQQSLVENFKNDQLHGPLKQYYPDGKLMSEGNYDKGEKTGAWKYYSRKGTVSSTEFHGENGLEGIRTYFNTDGSTDVTFEYVAGDRHGWKKKYDPAGNLLYQVRYEADVPVAYTWLDQSGKPLPEKPILMGTAKINTFYSNGKPSASFEYIDGKLHGKDLQFHFTGGTWMESTENYGETEGLLTTYHPNGKVRSTGNYASGNPHGVYRVFNEKGNLVEELNFYDGDYHGHVRYYDDNGKLINQAYYYYATLISDK
ncbi:MAG: tetratricopeptide repeat protein [Chitinophagaceae bacterium]|nr:MAG: tetratricopeptide repeat protein [Chitinophagaceae bacterium]